MPHTGLEPVLITELHFECSESTNFSNEAILLVGVVGFEPNSANAPVLQTGPALQLRRTPKILCQTTNVFSLIFCLQTYY